MKLKEAEVLKRLEHLPILIVNGSGDVHSGLEEAKWNYEAAAGSKELIVIEWDIRAPTRMEEATANHVFRRKEEEIIDETLSWPLKRVQRVV